MSDRVPGNIDVEVILPPRNALAAVPSVVSINPSRVTGPMSSFGAFSIFTAGPALTIPLREFRKNWFRFS